jgi:DNA-binding MarR family transcriptional regulator
MTNLKHEIKQKTPFSSLEEEAFLNLVRTSDFLQRAFQQKTRDWGVTSTQYNILRILRGAQPDGLQCAGIGARMVTPEPDITRLLARLKALKLVKQHRNQNDRRVVWTQISETGIKLLREMDPLIRKLPANLLGHMSKDELTEMIRLLERARLPCASALALEERSKA